MRPHRGEMTIAIVCALLKQLSVIGAAALTSYIVGLALSGTLGEQRRLLVTLLVICILVRALTYFGEMYFAHDVAFRVIRNYRLMLYEKICAIAPAYTLRTQTGQLGQSLVADVEILELFLAHTFSSFIVACVVTVSVILVMLRINVVLALLLTLTAVLLYAVPYAMRKRSDKQGARVRASLADANTTLVESVQGLREIITLRGETRFNQRIQSAMDRLYRDQYEYGRIKGTEVMSTHLISGLFTAAIMAFTAALVAGHRMDAAMYPVAVMLSTVILGPVSELTTVAQELGIVFAASNRVQEMLNRQPEVADTGTKEPVMDHCRVEFRDVGFSYDDSRDNVVRNICFTVGPGETVVLVGHTGAGKSTCANLLLRYWDPDEGSITINGTDLREYSIASLRKMVSAVQQETYLYHTTVRENIRIGRWGASDEDIENAAERANAMKFIRDLPDGYETVTGERGFRLSGGQRQRISIARALLRDAPIVIFDEAVSNLDTENEKIIQETLHRELKGKTVLMIAHRLSTIVSADKVVVLDHGRVVGQGTHSDLLETCEIYRNLVRNQLDQ